VHIVLEQQVSIVAARSLFRRVSATLGGMTPELVLERGAPGLHALGLTRQKASYCHALAAGVADGSLSLPGVARADDPEGRAALLALRGIGPWSADIYYLMALLLPDGAAPPGRLASRGPRARNRVAGDQAAAPTAGHRATARDERRLGAVAVGRGAAPVASLPEHPPGGPQRELKNP